MTVLNENQFLRLFNKGQNDQVWKRIDYIQTCLNVKIGIGRKIVVNFFAKINPELPETTISYNFHKYAKDKHLEHADKRAF